MTILVVMGRKDYGPIPRGGVVIDIGAHLGAFTHYALMEGAGKVYSFEPDPSLFGLLRRNVSENGLDDKVTACEAAVVSASQEGELFHPEGNASGHMAPATEAGGIAVGTVTLERVLLDNRIERVDLLKLDCASSECPIIFDTPDPLWQCIRSVRMEYHRGQVPQLTARFQSLGYRLVHARQASAPGTGLLWFDRPA